MHGTALKTSGGLTINDLMYNKHGRIVSKKKSMNRDTIRRLTDKGYHTCKGFFGSIETPEDMLVKCKAKEIHSIVHSSRKTRRSR